MFGVRHSRAVLVKSHRNADELTVRWGASGGEADSLLECIACLGPILLPSFGDARRYPADPGRVKCTKTSRAQSDVWQIARLSIARCSK